MSLSRLALHMNCRPEPTQDDGQPLWEFQLEPTITERGVLDAEDLRVVSLDLKHDIHELQLINPAAPPGIV